MPTGYRWLESDVHLLPTPGITMSLLSEIVIVFRRLEADETVSDRLEGEPARSHARRDLQ